MGLTAVAEKGIHLYDDMMRHVEFSTSFPVN